MTAKKETPEPPAEDDFYDGPEEGKETDADYEAEETNAKEVKE